jgi:hypothetical protein
MESWQDFIWGLSSHVLNAAEHSAYCICTLLSRCRKYGVDNAHEQQPLSQILLNIQSRRHDLWTQIDLTMTFNLIEYIKTSSPYTSEISKLLVPRSKTIWHLSYTSASIKLVSASAAESATDQNNERIAYRGSRKKERLQIKPRHLAAPFSKGPELLFTSSLSPGIAALSAPGLQFPPQADHVLRWLVVRGVVAIEATGLVEPEVVRIHHPTASPVELLNPHTHAHVFHLEQLQQPIWSHPFIRL